MNPLRMTTQNRLSNGQFAILFACHLVLGFPLFPQAAAAPGESDEALKVLNRYCAGCHNANDAEADFSLSDYASLMKGTIDGSVVQPGKPDESKLLQLMTGELEPKMPPEEEDQPTEAEIDAIRKWIAKGAKAPEKDTMRIDVPDLPPAATTYVGSACWVDGKVLLGSLRTIKLLNTESGEAVWEMADLPGKVNSLRMAQNGLVVVGTGLTGVGGLVAIIDPAAGRVIRSFAGHSDAVYCASLSPDGTLLATGSYDKSILIRDAQSGELLSELTGHNGAIYDLDFSSDGKLLATASADQTVKLWSVPEFRRLDTFGQPEGEMYCVRFSLDGNYVLAGGADRQIRKWKILSRDKPAINPMVHAVYAHESAVQNLAVTEHSVVTTANDAEAKQWDLSSLSPLGKARKLSGAPVALDVSRRGEALSVSLTGAIQRFMLAKRPPPIGSQGLHATAAEQSSAANDTSINQAAGQQVARAYEEQIVPDGSLIELPAVISGVIESRDSQQAADEDLFEFEAAEGETWIFQSDAPDGSPLDSWLEILDEDGNSVLRTRLQAIRESYFTFRGKDSSTSDDFRLHRWEDMELDEYLYSSGEVTRLWLYPRGPDSGFKVYPGAGARNTFFDTTPISHALGEPAYIVRELRRGEVPLPNGLPVFPIYFENDDDPLRRIGKNSRLTFTAPSTGRYQLRVRDARGFGGDDYSYSIDVRAAKPDFELKVQGDKLSMPVGSGREWAVTATRKDGLSGPIRIELEGVPDGFVATNPLIIEENQTTARGTIYATPGAIQTMLVPDSADEKDAEDEAKSKPPSATYRTTKIQLTATAELPNRTIRKELPPLNLTLSEANELQFRVVSLAGEPVERMQIAPGETISAKIILDRRGDKSEVSFGKEDSGRNLPHGAYVDNIGLNGLLIPAQYDEREFFITAAPKLRPGTVTQFHLRTAAKGSATSRPITIEVVSPTMKSTHSGDNAIAR